MVFARPVPITLPNIDNLIPGSQLNIWSLDPVTGTFVVVGTGQVTPDGSQIITIAGGIRRADWHFSLPPSPQPTAPGSGGSPESPENNNENLNPSNDCGADLGSTTSISSGDLSVEHTLIGYRSLGQLRSPRLVYHSLHANPRPVISGNAIIPNNTALPLSVSTKLSVAGVDQGVQVFGDIIPIGLGNEYRQAFQFDARNFPIGLYQYIFTRTSHYAQSEVSSIVPGKVLINNQINSPYGVGWTLEGLQRIIEQSNEVVIAEGGNGASLVFNNAANGTGDFLDQVTFPAGFRPRVATSDVNKDGNVDFTVANEDSQVSILLGNGEGDFSVPISIPARTAVVQSIVIADFNNDNNDDFALAGNFSAEVAIHFGDGAGGFPNFTVITVGSFQDTKAVTAADLNNDGNMDLALANARSRNVAVLLGGWSRGIFRAGTFCHWFEQSLVN